MTECFDYFRVYLRFLPFKFIHFFALKEKETSGCHFNLASVRLQLVDNIVMTDCY
jgi:hypothetical protein